MSASLLRTIPFRFHAVARPQTAAFSTSIARSTGFSSRHENDPAKLEESKQALLQKHKDGKADWHEDLASDAEAFVKAAREEIKHSDKEIEKLQNETNEILSKREASSN